MSVSSIGVPVKPMGDAFGNILRAFLLQLMRSLRLVVLVATSALEVTLRGDGEAPARAPLPDILVDAVGQP